MNKMLAVVVSCMFVGLVGCASTGNSGSATSGSAAQKFQINVVDRIPGGPNGSQPKWAENIGKDDKSDKEKIYYVASIDGYEDVDVSKKVAISEAQTLFAQEIKLEIRQRGANAIEQYGKSLDNKGDYVKNIFISAVKDLKVQGLAVEDIYSERIQEIQGSESKLYWRTYTRVSISRANYDKVAQMAFDKTKTAISPQDKSAKKLVEDAEVGFFEEKE